MQALPCLWTDQGCRAVRNAEDEVCRRGDGQMPGLKGGRWIGASDVLRDFSCTSSSPGLRTSHGQLTVFACIRPSVKVQMRHHVRAR